MKGLSQRQQQVLELVAGYLRDGVPPAAAQLAERLGLAGESSVTPVLQALARKGFLAILGGVRGRQRTL
ncbi:MAG TPA: repressor LexA, partial [Candidatus Ozemobacteraceae bacterium]|nr:repressor LexA [Candidatus Ozemobacteraceae bacterium]